jgi:hypothetical protein
MAITWRFLDKLGVKRTQRKGKNCACWVKEVRTLAVGLNYILKRLILDCKDYNYLKF